MTHLVSSDPCLLLLSALLAVAVFCAGAQAPGPAAAAAPAAEGATASGAAAGAAVCSLNIQGNGKSPGLRAASLSCTGGTIKVAAHRALQKFWGTKRPHGVEVSNDQDCTSRPRCLLSICGQSSALFISPKAIGVMQEKDLTTVLCVFGQSQVTLRSGTFSSNMVTSLGVFKEGTLVLVDQCQFRNNSIPPDGFFFDSSSMYVGSATVHIQSSTFAGNSAHGDEVGGVSASDAAKLSVRNCTFEYNKAADGAAIRLARDAEAKIYGSRFRHNKASKFGGAISTDITTKLDISPDKQAKGVHLLLLKVV